VRYYIFNTTRGERHTKDNVNYYFVTVGAQAKNSFITANVGQCQFEAFPIEYLSSKDMLRINTKIKSTPSEYSVVKCFPGKMWKPDPENAGPESFS
jgi:hypothetical protein